MKTRSWNNVAIPLAISLLVHAFVIGVGVWYVMRHITPTFSILSGSGGDGVRQGDIFIPVPAASDPTNELPAPPMMMDIVTATPTDTDDLIEPETKLSGDAIPLELPGSQFVVPRGGDPTPPPNFLPRYVAPDIKSGDGGLGGDGLDPGAAPSPSARNKPPRYPAEARRKGIEGTVVVGAELSNNGQVGAISVEQSSGSNILDQAATEAVKAWKFEPSIPGATLEGSHVSLPIRFSLREPGR